jgi:uncharacterized repeat protein (TIGR01451 family)
MVRTSRGAGAWAAERAQTQVESWGTVMTFTRQTDGSMIAARAFIEGPHPARAAWVLALAVALAACGGGGSGGGGTPPPPLPTVTAPHATTVDAGQPASFSVTPGGTGPFAYQWRRNGVAIPGATASTYVIAATTAADDGATISVVVTNGGGSIESAPARLTVRFAPRITSQPTGVAVATGAQATFTVAATGNPLPSFQWQRNGVDLPGGTEPSVTIAATSAADGGTFTVVASNALGAVTSGGALLEVLDPPVITADPVAVVVDEPQPATFSVTAAGSAPLTFSWTFNGAPLSGASASAITFSPTASSEDGAVLTATVTNRVGTITSAPAVLTVRSAPRITAQPQSVTVQAGQTATFSVAAFGVLPLSFQWRRNGLDIAGATASSFTTTATVLTDSGALFTVVVTNARGTVTSDPATLTVQPVGAPTITAQPQSVTVTVGQPATFTIAVTGAAPLAFVWQRNGVDIAGATAASFTTDPTALADNGSTFTVVVSNAVGSVTSAAAKLTVNTNTSPIPAAPPIVIVVVASSAGTSQVNPGDPDAGQNHSYAITAAPAHGSATVSATGLVTFTPTAGFTGSDSVTITVTDDGVPPLSGSVTIPVTVSATGVVTLTLTANPDPITATSLIRYELKVANPGTTTVSNIALTNVVQNGATIIIADSTGGASCGGAATCAPGTVVGWPAFTLAPGRSATVSATAKVASGVAAVIHDTATVTHAGGTISATRDISLIPAPASSILALGLEEDQDPVAPGSLLAYRITLQNPGTVALPATALGVVTASVPVGTTFVSASPGGTLAGNTVQWTSGTVAPGANRHFSYVVRVDAALGSGTVLQSQAQVLDGATSLARGMAATDVQVAPAVKLVLTANPDPLGGLLTPGNQVTYEFKVSNVGDSVVDQILLTDSMTSATIAIAGSTGSPTCGGAVSCAAGTVVTWPAFSLAPGQTQTFTATAQVAGGGVSAHNAAIVSFPGGSASQGHDVVQNTGNPLVLGMEEDRDPVRPGDQLTYTLVLGGIGTLPASNARFLTATVPAGTTLVSTSVGGAPSGNSVQWSLVSKLDPAESQRFTYTVVVDGTIPDGNVLRASAEIVEAGVSLVRAMAATEVKAVSPLNLTLTVNPDPAEIGAAAPPLVPCEIKVSNVGATPLTNVVLTDLVRNADVAVASSTGGAACGGATTCKAGSVVRWPAFTLQPGETRTVTAAVQNAGLNVIHTSVAATHAGGTVSQGHDLAVGGAGAQLFLRLSIEEDHDPVAPGDAITYTLVLVNTQNQPLPTSASGVLTSTIPDGATFVSASAGGTSAGKSVSWNVGAVPSNGNQRFSYTVLVDPALRDGNVLQATAEMLDRGLSVVRATAATDVTAGAPIRLALTANPDPPVGDAITYELTVSNLGATTVTDVAVTDVSDGTIFAASSTGGAACGGATTCPAGAIVSWPPFTLAPGQAQTVTAVAKNLGSSSALVHNRAAVAFPGGFASQGHAAVVNPVAGPPTSFARLGMEEDHDPVTPGERLTYTIFVGNTFLTLPASASRFLTATIPAGTTFATASAGGTASGNIVQWPIPTVTQGATREFSYTVVIDGVVPDGTVLQAQAQLLESSASVLRAMTATTVAHSPIELTVTANADPGVGAGNTQPLVRYELKVSNVGSSAVANIAVSDLTLASGTLIVADSTGGANCGGPATCTPGTIVTWPPFALAPGQTQTLTAVEQVAIGSAVQLHNAALVNFPGGIASKGSNVGLTNTAGLQLSSEEDHDPIRAGDQVIYTLTLANSTIGVLPASRAGVLVASVPLGTALVSASPGGVPSGNTVQWSFGSVAGGGALSFSYTVAAVATLGDGDVLEADAEVRDETASFARASSETEVRASPLTVTVTSTPGAAAGQFSYSFTLTNVGSTTLTGVALIDQTLNGATVQLGAPTGPSGAACGGSFTCGPGAIVTWPLFTLAPGQAQTVTIPLTVNATTTKGTLIRNAATATFAGGTVTQGLEVVVP